MYVLTKFDDEVCKFRNVEDLADKLSQIFELANPFKTACDLINDKAWRKKLGFKIIDKSKKLDVCAFRNVETGEIIKGPYAFCNRKNLNIRMLDSLFVDVCHIEIFGETWEVGEVRWIDEETGRQYHSVSELIRDLHINHYRFEKMQNDRFRKVWFDYEERSN